VILAIGCSLVIFRQRQAPPPWTIQDHGAASQGRTRRSTSPEAICVRSTTTASKKLEVASSEAAAYQPTRPGHFVAAAFVCTAAARDTSSYAVAKNEPD